MKTRTASIVCTCLLGISLIGCAMAHSDIDEVIPSGGLVTATGLDENMRHLFVDISACDNSGECREGRWYVTLAEYNAARVGQWWGSTSPKMLQTTRTKMVLRVAHVFDVSVLVCAACSALFWSLDLFVIPFFVKRRKRLPIARVLND